jgi:uncharacterized protein YneF (UPF0154 family)
MSNYFEPFRLLSFLPKVGFTFVFFPLAGFLLGYWLDARSGGVWFFLPISVASGVILGWYATYRLIVKFFGDDNDKNRNT